MALRKMLGSIDHPEIIRLMRLIEAQSELTLTRFAADYAEAYYLPITDEPDPVKIDWAAELSLLPGNFSRYKTQRALAVQADAILL